MWGLYNRILEINISTKESRVISLSEEVLESCLGGKGLALHLLLQYNPQNIDPLSPDNRLIFANGPVSGTSIWGSCRNGVFTKAPQTGYFSESYSGGKLSVRLAATCFDAVMLHGASDTPICIEISENGATFHEADELWGLETYESEDRFQSWILNNRPEAKKCSVCTIGPAGENQVSFSVIENDYWRSAGRTGVGAVMGSKGVKAVAFWGNKQKEVADPDKVKNFAKHITSISKDNKGVEAYKTSGTPMLVDMLNTAGAFPTRYWQKGVSDHWGGINATALHERCDVKPNACLQCLMACGRLSTVKEGRHAGLRAEGPEYETIFAFGGLCEVSDIEEILYLNDICDRLGLDTISAGNLAAFTIEASRQGKIDLDIDYGEVDKIASLLQDIAYRKGIGDELARGIKIVSRQWGMEEQAVHVKGLEPAGYDPRVLKGMGLAYGTSDRGACHLRATFYKPELAGMIDPDVIEGKAEMFAEWEDRLTLFDCLILCRFYRDLYQWEELAEMINATTGLQLSTEQMRKIARSVTDNARWFNIREGLTPDEDKLPQKFYKEIIPEKEKIITEEQMNTMLKEYYKARGWDENGVPQP